MENFVVLSQENILKFADKCEEGESVELLLTVWCMKWLVL